MPDIEHSLHIRGAPDQVWVALTTNAGVSRWWSLGHTQITGDPGVLGRFQLHSGLIAIQIDVIELTASARVRWSPVEANSPGGWTGTIISFDLSSNNQGTRLVFAHRGFAEDNEGYRIVTDGWARYLQNLKQLIDTNT